MSFLPATIVHADNPATHFLVTAPTSTPADQPFNVTVTARDASNATVTSYAGTVQITSSDTAATVPPDYAYNGTDKGTHTFSVTLHNGPSQTVTATDTSDTSITGTSNSISVTAPPPATGGSGPPPFHPGAVGAPSDSVLPDGSQQLVFWKSTGGHLEEAWYAGRGWNGPLDVTNAYLGGAAPLLSAPTAAVTPDGSTQLVFWQGVGGHLFEAWYAGGEWHGPLDISGAYLGGAVLNSAPNVTNTPDGHQQMVFWRGALNHLFEAWYAGGSWHGPADLSAADFAGLAPLASAPSTTVTRDGSTQVVFWQGAAGQLDEAWYAGGGWHGPLDLTNGPFGGSAPLLSAPSVTTTTDGSQQLVYWQGAGGHLDEAWFAAGVWHGPSDITGSFLGGAGTLTAAPSVTVTPDGSSQVVFWQGAGSSLWEAWYTGNWNGPDDFSG